MKAGALLPLLLGACAGGPAPREPAEWFAARCGRAFAIARCPAGWIAVGGRPAVGGAAAVFTADGGLVAEAAIGDDVAYAVAVDAAGRNAAVGMADGRVLLLPLPRLEPAVECWRHGRAVTAVAFSPTDGDLASAGHDGVVRVGAAAAGAASRSLQHTAAVVCLAWSRDGALVASGAQDGKVRLHERSGRLVRLWNRLGGEVTAVAWADSGLTCEVRRSPLEPAVRLELP